MPGGDDMGLDWTLTKGRIFAQAMRHMHGCRWHPGFFGHGRRASSRTIALPWVRRWRTRPTMLHDRAARAGRWHGLRGWPGAGVRAGERRHGLGHRRAKPGSLPCCWAWRWRWVCYLWCSAISRAASSWRDDAELGPAARRQRPHGLGLRPLLMTPARAVRCAVPAASDQYAAGARDHALLIQCLVVPQSLLLSGGEVEALARLWHSVLVLELVAAMAPGCWGSAGAAGAPTRWPKPAWPARTWTSGC